MTDRATLLTLIDIQKRKLQNIDEKIGRLMSKRASCEDRLAEFYDALNKLKDAQQ